MADKSIDALPQASTITLNDLFVVQQGNTAKSVTGAVFLAMVEAHGGIASVSLGADYKLTLVFADGTSWTSAIPIRGETGATGATGATGNGIASAVLNADYTLTLNFTDGTSYTTTSIRGQQGVDGIYPLSATPAWNAETRAGTVTPNVTLPTPPTTTTAELRYTFTAESSYATFTAPIGYILGDGSFEGLSFGNTVYLLVTQGNIYECSFAVIDNTHIGMYMKEWAV